MAIDDLKARARAQASEISITVETSLAGEVLRADAMRFFSRVPEPPVYRRRDDPAVVKAKALIIEGEKLLAQSYALERLASGLHAWSIALERHLEAMSLLSEGKIEAAEAPWHEALAAERVATASKRLWSRDDGVERPVFDKAGARSRFDPAPEASMKMKLVCPMCRKTGDYACSPRHATHGFVCTACRAPFSAYFGEVRACEVLPLTKGRRYTFRLDELSGAQTQLQVDDWGKDELPVARRDLMAFLYSPSTQLRGVLNLSSSRVLWVTSSSCFVATVAFGADAPELDVLRAFREQVLRETPAGRAFIEWYYRSGPALAQWVSRHRGVRWLVRRALLVTTRWLQ